MKKAYADGARMREPYEEGPNYAEAHFEVDEGNFPRSQNLQANMRPRFRSMEMVTIRYANSDAMQSR